jgi:hypothetical protein
MQLINRPIEVITHTDMEGKMTPAKFRVEDEDGALHVFRIERVITQEKQRQTGGVMSIKYVCQVLMNGQMKTCELRYWIDKTIWKLERI